MLVEFRPLAWADLPLLADWLSRPHVKQWWQEEHDLASVTARYGPSLEGSDKTELFIVVRAGQPIGMALRYLLSDNAGWLASLAPSGRHDESVGIDYLIGEESLLGRGIGPAMIGAFVELAWARYPSATGVVVSVAQDNRRSWRALEKAGFKRIWAGEIASDDPSDQGPSFVYVLPRPAGPA